MYEKLERIMHEVGRDMFEKKQGGQKKEENEERMR